MSKQCNFESNSVVGRNGVVGQTFDKVELPD